VEVTTVRCQSAKWFNPTEGSWVRTNQTTQASSLTQQFHFQEFTPKIYFYQCEATDAQTDSLAIRTMPENVETTKMPTHRRLTE
jgi:hypothetical protein